MRAIFHAGFTAALLLAATALPAAEVEVRDEIAAEYAAYDRAALGGVAGLRAWCEQNLTDDFTIAEQGGETQTREQFMEMLRQMAAHPDPLWQGVRAQRTVIDRLDVESGRVIVHVTVRGEYEGRDAQGRFGPKDAAHVFEQTAVYRETWIRNGTDWKVRASEQLGRKMLMDGKPFPPAK